MHVFPFKEKIVLKTNQSLKAFNPFLDEFKPIFDQKNEQE